MDYHYKPFIVSADFDDHPETIDKERWVAGASVELGDINGPKYKDSRSKFARWLDKKLFGQSEHTDERSFNVFFTFFVCSPAFKDNPTDVYKKYVHIMHVQNQYDKQEAAQYL